jgi:hypothetical protein
MCKQCEALTINGVLCREIGCPAPRETECSRCGAMFTPEQRGEKTCSHSCYVSYNGISCSCEECGTIEELETQYDMCIEGGAYVQTM